MIHLTVLLNGFHLDNGSSENGYCIISSETISKRLSTVFIVQIKLYTRWHRHPVSPPFSFLTYIYTSLPLFFQIRFLLYTCWVLSDYALVCHTEALVIVDYFSIHKPKYCLSLNSRWFCSMPVMVCNPTYTYIVNWSVRFKNNNKYNLVHTILWVLKCI